jgi:hypothetical protein
MVVLVSSRKRPPDSRTQPRSTPPTLPFTTRSHSVTTPPSISESKEAAARSTSVSTRSQASSAEGGPIDGAGQAPPVRSEACSVTCWPTMGARSVGNARENCSRSDSWALFRLKTGASRKCFIVSTLPSWRKPNPRT